jgi:hypothetical protein
MQGALNEISNSPVFNETIQKKINKENNIIPNKNLIYVIF